MKKLYIDQQGIIKVIDVPEEPSVSISIYQDMARVNRYDRELAAAKEAGIEVHNQEQAKAMCNGWHFSCCPGKHRFDKTCLMIGTIHDLPEGWSIYFAWRCLKCGRLDCISCDSDCELDQKVVVLLPPVSEKEDVDKMFNEWIGEPVEKVETQEELWNSIENVVSDEITKYWIEIPADQLAFNIMEAIKEKFILTRKP